MYYATINGDKKQIGQVLGRIDEIVENAILLDTQISDNAKNNKKGSTTFMHYLYAPITVNNAPFLVKLTVEEYGIGSDKRGYNVQRIKMSTLQTAQFSKMVRKSGQTGSSAMDAISISELYDFVKTNNAKFVDTEILNAKMRASTELDNLIDAGRNFRNVKDGENGHNTIIKLTVEEQEIPVKGNIKRAYKLIDIRKHQPSGVVSTNSLNSSQTADAVNTISDLYRFVKTYDKDFHAGKEVNPLLLNDDGTPRVFYHGAKKGGGFSVFRDWQYFTESKKYAERYTDRNNDKSLYSVYLKMDNPFDTRQKECAKIFENMRREYGLSELQENGLPDWTDGYDIAAFIEENDLDYDGIILDEGGDLIDGKPVSRGLSYVVRNSTQIKSATDNIGTFDGSNQDIRYSKKNNSENDNEKYIDRYSEKEYNERGWVAVHNVLSLGESKNLYTQFADYKKRKYQYPTTDNGEAIIMTEDSEKQVPHLVLIKGTINSPIITKVIEAIDNEYSYEILEDLRNGAFHSKGILLYVSEKELFIEFSRESFAAYSELSKQRRSVEKGKFNNSESSERRSGFEGDTETEIKRSKKNAENISNREALVSALEDYYGDKKVAARVLTKAEVNSLIDSVGEALSIDKSQRREALGELIPDVA